MVLVSHKYNFIYIKNYKVAGSSVEAFFGQFCINPKKNYKIAASITQSIDNYGIIGSREPDVRKNDIWKNHIDALKIKTNLGDDKFNTYFKFANIRNPYDAIVSAYFFEKSKENFKDYAKKKIITNLERCSINNESVCDFYIRYEHILEDIVEVCKILKIDNYDINDLPKFKSCIRKNKAHYRDYYDEETRIKVYENHKKTFEQFKYEF
jgi:hypothetical protein